MADKVINEGAVMFKPREERTGKEKRGRGENPRRAISELKEPSRYLLLGSLILLKQYPSLGQLQPQGKEKRTQKEERKNLSSFKKRRQFLILLFSWEEKLKKREKEPFSFSSLYGEGEESKAGH